MNKRRSSFIIASTFGQDISDMAECRYQSTRTKQAIYALGNAYYATGLSSPKDSVGKPWEKYQDQSEAGKYGTILWESKV